jgi:translation initiation factor 2B subunit (eIF-2B alpha/beta/delta family)
MISKNEYEDILKKPNPTNIDLRNAIDYLQQSFETRLREGIKNICDVVISKYDFEISENKTKIEQLQKTTRQLEVSNWVEETL